MIGFSCWHSLLHDKKASLVSILIFIFHLQSTCFKLHVLVIVYPILVFAIFRKVGFLPWLSMINFFDNMLNGTIPLSFSNLTSLGKWGGKTTQNSESGLPRVDSRSLSYMRPFVFLFYVYDLEELTFQFNDITGYLPEAICPLRNLWADCGKSERFNCSCCTFCCLPDLNQCFPMN